MTRAVLPRQKIYQTVENWPIRHGLVILMMDSSGIASTLSFS
jgi:hypothetical protein